MGQYYNRRTVFSIAFLLTSTLFRCFGAENAPSRAILEVGTITSAGVPGFGPNRLPCLFGQYALGELGSVGAYAVSDPVLFDPARWKRGGTAAQPLWIALADGRRVVAAAKDVPVANPESVPRSWHFFLAFPDAVSESDCLAVFAVFLDRAAFFFSSAKSRETLSFPAVLEVPGR